MASVLVLSGAYWFSSLRLCANSIQGVPHHPWLRLGKLFSLLHVVGCSCGWCGFGSQHIWDGAGDLKAGGAVV